MIVMSRFKRWGIGAVLLAQGACMTSPRPIAEPTPLLQSKPPKQIWVSLTNGQELVIRGPKVYGDTLLGFTEKNGASEEVWLPLTDLKEVRARHLSGARTALLGGAIAVVVGALVLSIPTEGGEVVRRCMNEGEPCESA